MSWHFKDPIVTVALLNFDCIQSNIKKWPEKIKLPQTRFFLRKQLLKFSCKSLLLSKINKKIWEQIQSEEDTIPFLFQNHQIALNKISFRKNINIISMSLLAPSIVQNNPYSWPRVVRQDVTFCILNSPFGPSKHFLGNNTNIIFIYLLTNFIAPKFIIFYNRPSYGDEPLLDPKWTNLPKPIFFGKLVDKPSFYHSCLSKFQKSKSDINLLMKYWWLKTTEISFFPGMQFSQNVKGP